MTSDRQVKYRYGLPWDFQQNDLIASGEEENADRSFLEHDLGNGDVASF